MTSDIKRLERRIASRPLSSDYDFWRALRDLNDELYALSKRGEPIPFESLRLRATLRGRRAARGQSED